MTKRIRYLGGVGLLALSGLVAACGQPGSEAPEASEDAGSLVDRVEETVSAAVDEAVEAAGDLAEDAEAAIADGVEAAEELADDVVDGAAAAVDTVQLAAVLSHPRREDDRVRDEFRHPLQTLEFFGIQSDMTVVEVLPGGGWYSRVVVPYVSENGRYGAVNYSLELFEGLFGDRLTDERRAEFAAFPEEHPGKVREMFAGTDAEAVDILGAYAFGSIPEEAEGEADAVLFIRALHNLERFGSAEAAAADAYALLAPGGVAGVVQHRAKPDAPAEYVDGSKGYLTEARVIEVFESAGFVLDGASEVNANLADSADWPMGVWTLPPALRAGDEETYRAIGESDRMTLLFRKPATPAEE